MPTTQRLWFPGVAPSKILSRLQTAKELLLLLVRAAGFEPAWFRLDILETFLSYQPNYECPFELPR